MPEISVIIPIYNVEDYISQCLDSALASTCKSIEFILVDDGSTDNSGKICDEYAKNHQNVAVIHQKNGGLSAARNSGIDYVFQKGSSKYIAFLDGDDAVHPQMYEILLYLIKKTGADMSACRYRFVKPFEAVDCELYSAEEYDEYELIDSKDILNSLNEYSRRVSLVSACMKLYNVKIFKDIRFMNGYTEEDSLLLPHVLLNSKSIARNSLPLYLWTVREGSISHSSFNKNSFSFLRVSYENAVFFEQIGIDSQKKFYRKQFMNRCVRFSLMIAKHKELKKHLTEYRNIYNKEFSRFLPSCDFSKAEYLMHILFRLHLPFAGSIYKKMYPDYETVF